MICYMKKLPILILFLIINGNLSAQNNINVLSFSKLENDLDARVKSPLKDLNGDLCAIIKVITTQSGFSFDCGQIGVLKTVVKPNAIWVYVPYSAREMTITHPQLGMLQDYIFPVPIEKGTVYNLVITTGQTLATTEEPIDSPSLSIHTEPSFGMIYLNDKLMKTGDYSAKLKPGRYNYRVEAPLYHTEAGIVEITGAKKNVLVTLKPAFGYIKVNSFPEQAATIFIDGKQQIQLSPSISEPLANGEHNVQVIKEMYLPLTQKITVKENEITVVDFKLTPNFADFTVTTMPDATIFINNSQKGIGNWSGRLDAGTYSIEVQKDNYHPAKNRIELVAGDKRSLILQPTPIFGSINVNSSPVGATIRINGNDSGTTPNTIDHLKIGDYAIQLSLQGYSPINKTVKISEGLNPEINETLSNGKLVKIISYPPGIDLFIDDKAYGRTPFQGNLPFGEHKLRIEKDDIKTEKTISINESDVETNFSIALGASSYSETVNGVSFDMVAIKGGTFEMGSNESEFSKPKHLVTVSDFNIGRTEVSQALWKAVMGSNPSEHSGDEFPVEKVSWTQVQEFIHKLNDLTGRCYRLPTEAEWEFAASTVPDRKNNGTFEHTKFSGTNYENKIGDYAWYEGNSKFKTHPVGQKLPNVYGLYDMSGNVNEYCIDFYSSYTSSPQINPRGEIAGEYRISRGGSFGWDPDNTTCRTSFRYRISPDTPSLRTGFRLVGIPLP